MNLRAGTSETSNIFIKLLTGLCLLVLASTGALAQDAGLSPTVLKVEPPSWWAGHSINPVRLVVRGTNLHGARVAGVRPETSTSSVVVSADGTYLFVSITIKAGARVGDYPLQLET